MRQTKENDSVVEYIILTSTSDSETESENDNVSNKSCVNVERHDDSDSSIEVLPTPEKPPVPLIDLTSIEHSTEKHEERKNMLQENKDVNDCENVNKSVVIKNVNESVVIISNNDDELSAVLNSDITDLPNNNDSVQILNNSESDSCNLIELNTSIPNLEQHVTSLLQQEYENVERKRKRKRDHSDYSRKAKRAKTYNLPGSDGIHWTQDMKKFYNKSWGGEDFDHKVLINSMPADPELWRISSADYRLPHRPSDFVRMRCFNCYRIGHGERMCPEPRKAPCCSMCGKKGHYESHCRHAICLLCGQPSRSYDMGCYNCRNPNPRMQMPCVNCGAQNHMPFNVCPYSWKIMHSTTSENMRPPRIEERLKPERELQCPNCARVGHQYETCPELYSFVADPYLNTYSYNVFIPTITSDQQRLMDRKKKLKARRKRHRQKMRQKLLRDAYKKSKRRRNKKAGIML